MNESVAIILQRVAFGIFSMTLYLLCVTRLSTIALNWVGEHLFLCWPVNHSLPYNTDINSSCILLSVLALGMFSENTEPTIF
ncbi:hypothetical protein JHK86_043438 [Glycine max]|nr:hypothetical protein JHK86_043438 [Glycine max]